MSKLDKWVYGTLGVIITDTAIRAYTGEGFVEKLGPFGNQLLENLGLVHKSSTELTNLVSDLDIAGRAHLEDLVDNARKLNIDGYENSTNTFVGYLNNKIDVLKEVSSSRYIADKIANARVTAYSLAAIAILYLTKRIRKNFMRTIMHKDFKFSHTRDSPGVHEFTLIFGSRTYQFTIKDSKTSE